MRYQFLVDTYETEILKVLSVWSMFRDADLPVRPHASDKRGRSVLEQMVHQCMSEDGWFRTMLGIDVGATPLPADETRAGFIERYRADATHRLAQLREKDDAWWEQEASFFGNPRSRAWIMVRRVAHTSHHRGQQTAMLRMLNRDLHSNYGPTADTGGLPKNGAPVIYAYPHADAIVEGEKLGGKKTLLPDTCGLPVTERPPAG
ncbi:MAG: DinB family protein [Bryobacteraceae bacterium]